MSRRFSAHIPAAVAAASVALLFLLPWLGSGGYLLYLVTLGMSYALAALGLNIIMGYGPDISLGQHAFFAIGAYTTAIGMDRLGLAFAVALPLGALLSAVLSCLIALSAVRLHGLYLAIGTLAFGLVVDVVIRSAAEVTGGRNGMAVTGFSPDVTTLYLMTAAIFVVVVALYRNFVLGGYGEILTSLRDHRIAAQSLGVNVVRIKLLSFMVCGALAGLGGGLYAVAVTYIASESFSLNLSLIFILMVVVGGAGSVYGPIIGAAFATALPEVTRDFGAASDIAYGLAIVLVMLFMRGGIVGLLRRIPARTRDRPDAVEASEGGEALGHGRERSPERQSHS